MKLKDMSKQERKEYNRKKIKEWREKNPKRNKELRKRYKQSEKGKEANRKYSTSEKRKAYMRKYMRKNPEKFKRSKEYMREYMKNYMMKHDNHNKYLLRQKDYFAFRKKLIDLYKECQECGSKENLEMHHLDYSDSNIGNIIILCRKCHRHLHRIYKNKRRLK